MNLIEKHVLQRINDTNIGVYPFYYLYIENIFTDDFYEKLKKQMLYYKYNSLLQDRNWDHPNFINKKYHLTNINDDTITVVKNIFNSDKIKQAFLEKFYIEYTKCDKIVFEKDLQFVFTEKDKFQRIHTDIPAQYLSVVFYLPEDEISVEDELNNGTILYDKNLQPHKVAKFKNNSLCCFAPHFYSYHGFNTTINNRNTMLFFYANEDYLTRFYDNINNENGDMNVENFKNIIEKKITKYKLIEYGLDNNKIIIEKERCKIDGLNGRIMD